MKKLLVLLALLFGIARADAQDWQWLNPKPQANTLRSIAFTDQDNGIAVGDGGAIVRTTNGGASWISLPLATFSGLCRFPSLPPYRIMPRVCMELY